MRAKLNFVFLLAWRFLREGRAQTILTLFGITLGIAVIVLLTRLIDRLESSMVDRVLSSQAQVSIRAVEHGNQSIRSGSSQLQDIYLQPRTQQEQYITDWKTVEAVASKQPEVLAVASSATGSVFVRRGQALKSVALMGVNPETYKKIVNMDKYMLDGKFELTTNQVIIGVELAQALGATVNDKIFLQNASGLSDMLVVGGIFDIGNRDLNRRWVFTSIKQAQTLLEMDGGVSVIDIKIKNIFNANQVADKLKPLTGLTVDSWMRTNKQLMEALRSQSSSNIIIRFFLVLMIITGIVSVLAVTVVQKRKEIGILRAMGSTRNQIMAIFISQGAILGFVGSVIGVALASIVIWILSIVPLDLGIVLPFMVITVKTAGFSIVGATFVGMLAASMPARMAAKLDVIQAIQG